MAKTSSIYRNLKRVKMAEKYANRRLKLKNIADDKNASPEERFNATLKLAELPRNSARVRIRNRFVGFFFIFGHFLGVLAVVAVSVGIIGENQI